MIIQANQQHRSFVLSTWIRSYRDAYLGPISYNDIHKYESKFAEQAFELGMVFVQSSDGFTVNGWVCGKITSPQVLHWVYVPPELRGMGVASSMIRDIYGKIHPQVSRCPRRNSKLPISRWNPYLVLELEPEKLPNPFTSDL